MITDIHYLISAALIRNQKSGIIAANRGLVTVPEAAHDILLEFSGGNDA
jgi:hypothetical protein